MDNARDLRDEVGYWGEHPEYPAADWQAEVAAGETREGYWQWLASRLAGAALASE